jgi:hypothetical protein
MSAGRSTVIADGSSDSVSDDERSRGDFPVIEANMWGGESIPRSNLESVLMSDMMREAEEREMINDDIYDHDQTHAR